MEPGKVFTRDDLKKQFNFKTDEGTDLFLDLLEDSNSAEFQVVHFLDERLLVFEEEYWELFLDFMRSMGYNRDSDA